jgi:hypothetical protein
MITQNYFVKNTLIGINYLLVKELANVSISLIYKENEKVEIEKQLDDMEQQLISVGTQPNGSANANGCYIQRISMLRQVD